MQLDDGVGLDNVWIYTDKQKCVLIYAGNIGGRNYMYMWKSRDGRRDGYACVRLAGCAMYHVCGIRWITNNDVTKDVIHFLDARGMRASVRCLWILWIET